MGRVGNFIDFISNQANLTEAQKDIFTRIAYGAATKEEIDELKTKIKPKQNMKLTELKNMIQEEITKILSEQPETQEKEKVETDTEVTPVRRRKISTEDPIEEPARAFNDEPTEAIVKKIAARFKKGK